MKNRSSGSHNTIRANSSYGKQWKQIYTNTEIDSWHVGEFSSASYHITVEFDSNQKETMQVLVVARPDHASYTVFGRTSIQDELITLSASVNSNKMILTASPASSEFTGAKAIFSATYAETINPLSLPTTVVDIPSGGGTGGNPVQVSIGNIVVPGQLDVTATTESDTISFLTGSGVSIVTNSETKSLIFNASVNLFKNIVVNNSPTLSPNSENDSLTFVAGDGIEINTDILTKSVTIESSIASSSTLGSVKVDGSSITINSNGVISSSFSLPTASTSTLGGVKVDGSTITINNGVISSQDVSNFLTGTAAATIFLPLTGGTLTGNISTNDNNITRVMLKDVGYTFYDSSTTNTLDYTNGSHQRWAPSTGAQTLLVNNWPPSGNLGELLIEGINLGASTITWPTVNWVKSDGTTTTTFSANGVTLQTSGTDWVVLWTRNAGTTIYGKVMR